MKFQQEIVNWYQLHKRDLPWRHTQDAYVIWLSEIIMQQTRVEQGLPYFNRFLEAFPRLEDFASATEAQVLRLWQGLGYYSRGRNMHHTAQQVLALHEGVFPVQYDELIKLKGIGDYTASAISSFAAGELRAVLDGNVFRVLARYFGIAIPINSTEGKKEFSALAQELIVGQNPMLYNQAIMEFGALQCKPKSPDCEVCPLQDHCEARRLNLQHTLPVKLKKMPPRNRYFNYLIMENDGNILVKKRQPGDIWQHLYDFPLIETAGETGFPDEFLTLEIQKLCGEQVVIQPLMAKKHVLTHQIIYVQFFALANYIINFNQDAGVKWVGKMELDDLPQPIVITNFINAYLTK
ncbi:A/G-specific adenine glycosylase [Pedobacter sp. CAN_A7]|uniref:A/G-specific adenine glycosylase n=1 Tax=Pedobacter sp. CAN_A7 TaxID=2787722 RepID=UPI0018CB91D9